MSIDKTRIYFMLGGLMADARAHFPCYCHICFWDDKIQILPFSHTKKEHTVFRPLNAHELINGLTPTQWDRVVKKILLFLEYEK